jgi:hypothetical protein
MTERVSSVVQRRTRDGAYPRKELRILAAGAHGGCYLVSTRRADALCMCPAVARYRQLPPLLARLSPS